MLDFRGYIPGVRPDTGAAKDVVRPVGRELVAAERHVAHGAALAILGRVRQVSVGRVSSVDGAPGAGHAVDRCRHGVVRGGDVAGVDAEWITADEHLQRRSAGTEQVVAGAKPRIPVFPLRNLVDRREVADGHPGAGWQVLLRHRRVEVVETQTVIERQPPHGPLVLHVDPEVRLQRLLLAEGRRNLLDLDGSDAPEAVRTRTVWFQTEVANALLDLNARF